MHRMEIIVGTGVGILAYLQWKGFNILPVLFLLGIVAALFYVGNQHAVGRSFAAMDSRKARQSLIRFEDIGGQDVAKNELCEALEFIKNAAQVREMGIRPLKGVLLTGPPGTGKTLLAKAAAQFTNSSFLAASGSEFVEMYVGVGAQRIRKLFSQARDTARRNKLKSAVIFIDEIDVLGGKRGQSGNNQEHDQTLNELLVQMDGLSLEDEICCLVIAATNRPEALDQALLRPGRFDRQVRVDLPDKKGRLHILHLHTRNKPLAEAVDLEEIAADTFGFSGAHLENVANEAAILALRDGAGQIEMRHLRSAVEKVILGEKLDRTPVAEEKQRVAVHEAGHALVSELTRPGSVATVNVAARNNALGYVRQTQESDIYLYTKDQLLDRIAVALAGAAAEELMLGSRSTGAANDFKQATDVARQIVFAGLSELGVVSADDLPRDLLHQTVRSIIQNAGDKVNALLAGNSDALQRIVGVLQEQDSISGAELRAMMQKIA
ncbi:Vesicle-fusing ATPase [Acetonema longum DSM 6540]|uniref:Vesicle-fusing ATPase n=2 Tax=Acetonema TaxID=2373 RepID=F7NEF8_9FIRM|nr:Vesicle-fusing ATPase [Acetonema longum DSM 6540]